MLPLETEPFVKSRPLSSLKIKASDHVELEGGDSIIRLDFVYVLKETIRGERHF